MHILLTDLLTCPHCGPGFGLIVLADRIEERQVVEGRLGCPNCRESYPIVGGVADLRHRVVPALPLTGELRPDPERAFRTAALLGVSDANATVLVAAPTPELVPAMAEVLPLVHMVGVAAGGGIGPAAGQAVSETVTGERLPFRDRSMKGVALIGILSRGMLEEAARLLSPGARLVVEPAPRDLGGTLAEVGFQVHLEQDGVVVAGLPGHS